MLVTDENYCKAEEPEPTEGSIAVENATAKTDHDAIVAAKVNEIDMKEGLKLNLINDLEVQLQGERSGHCSLLPYQEGGGVEMGWILIRKF